MTPVTQHLVLVEDDSSAQHVLLLLLSHLFPNYVVRTCSTGGEALHLLATLSVACIITDYHLPDMDGIRLAGQVRSYSATTPVILLTGSYSRPITTAALEAGCAAVLDKPVKAQRLRETIQSLLVSSTSHRQKS